LAGDRPDRRAGGSSVPARIAATGGAVNWRATGVGVSWRRAAGVPRISARGKDRWHGQACGTSASGGAEPAAAAPLLIEAWEDVQCPACRRAALTAPAELEPVIAGGERIVGLPRAGARRALIERRRGG
jgi:hypothetical protein